MDDRDIRLKLLELIRDNPSISRAQDMAKILRVSPLDVEANLDYLAARDFLEVFHRRDGSSEYMANENSRNYINEPDSADPPSPRHRPGPAPLGGYSSPAPAEEMERNGIPAGFAPELQQLLEDIRQASYPKREQAVQVRAFLDQVSQFGSGAVVSAAGLLFEAAVGLPTP